jgi:hypothetical protein
MEIKKPQKNPKIFKNKKCHILCNDKNESTKHISSTKDKMEIDGNKMDINTTQ